MNIYSIGFTQRSAESFFNTLKSAGIRRLLDVRLNNTSQLAAFAKRDDLAYFLKTICNAEYQHEPLLAPTQEISMRTRRARVTGPPGSVTSTHSSAPARSKRN